jgi:electron transfer flavoprotein beta subunit
MRQIKIIVCLKQVPDPEGPASAFEVDSETKKVTPVGIPPVINPFDENALEAALQLKDSSGGRVIAISLGAKLARPVLTKALSVGADDLILLEDENFRDLDSYSTAYVLSKAIEKIGEYDLILAGRQAGDWDSGQTGLIIAEILQIPGINLARRVRVEDGKVVVEKLKRNGYEVVRALMPALITVSSEIGDLRKASLKDLITARKKPLTVWDATDLEVYPQILAQRKVYRLFAPSRERKCTLIEGQSSEEKGENLAIRLKEDKVI